MHLKLMDQQHEIDRTTATAMTVSTLRPTLHEKHDDGLKTVRTHTHMIQDLPATAAALGLLN